MDNNAPLNSSVTSSPNTDTPLSSNHETRNILLIAFFTAILLFVGLGPYTQSQSTGKAPMVQYVRNTSTIPKWVAQQSQGIKAGLLQHAIMAMPNDSNVTNVTAPPVLSIAALLNLTPVMVNGQAPGNVGRGSHGHGHIPIPTLPSNATVYNLSATYGLLNYSGVPLSAGWNATYILNESINATTNFTVIYNVTVMPEPSYICINLTSLSEPGWSQNICQPGMYHLSLASYKGHFGLNGPTTIPITARLSSSLIGNNTALYNYTIRSGGEMVAQGINLNDSSIERTITFSYKAGDSLNVSMESSGNNNYSAEDPTVFPNNVIYYQGITLQNTQTGAVPTNSQLPIPFNALAVTSYISSSANNIEIFNLSTGAILDSWMEGNTANEQQTTSLNTVAGNTMANSLLIWIKYPQGISGNTKISNAIGIGFGNVITGTNFLSSTVTGEAPQLSTPYAVYDTGYIVFNALYTNLGGTSAPTGWTGTTTGSPTVTYSNSLSTSVSSGANYYYLSNTVAVTFPAILDSLEGIATCTGSGSNCFYGVSSSTTSATATYGSGQQAGNFAVRINAVQTTTSNAVAGSPANSVYSSALSSSLSTFYLNYFPEINSTSTPVSGTSYAFLSNQHGATGSYTSYIQWLRARSYPPGDVEPTVSISPISSAAFASLSLANTLNPSYIDVLGGYPSDNALITATCTTGDTCQIWYSGASHASGTSSVTLAYNALPYGITPIYANDITSSVISTTDYINRIYVSHIVTATLTNNQGTATAVRTPLAIGTTSTGNIIGFNALAYNTWEANTLNNTAIAYTNGTVGYSWLEGNLLNEQANSNTLINSANVLYWYDSPPSSNAWLAASSSVNVIIAFDTTTNSVWDGNFIGVAPQLTCANPTHTSACTSGGGESGIYGQFDTGALVFSPLYQDFKGSTLPSGWQSSAGPNVIQSNGVSTTYNGASEYYATTANYGSNSNQIGDIFGSITSKNSIVDRDNTGFGYSTTPVESTNSNAVEIGANSFADCGSLNAYVVLTGSTTGIYGSNTVGCANGANSVFNIYFPASTFAWFALNYSSLTAVSSSPNGNTIPFGFNQYNVNDGQASTNMQWARIRTTPPNNIMPGESFSPSGSSKVSSLLVANTPLVSNVVIDSGQSTTLTAQVTGGNTPYTYKWYTSIGKSQPLCNLANLISGAVSSSLTVSPTTTNTYAYQVTDATTPNAVVECSAPSIIGTITGFSLQPTGISVAPNGQYAYVITNGGGAGTIGIINTVTETLTGTTITGFNEPHSSAFATNGLVAYADDQKHGDISSINTQTNTVIASYSGFPNPLDIAMSSQNLLYVVYNSGSSVGVWNPITLSTINTITVASGCSHGVDVSPYNSYGYITNNCLNTVSIFSTISNTITGTVTGTFNSPTGIEFAPNGAYATVSNNGNNTESIINTSTNSISGTVMGFNGPHDESSLPNGLLQYVSNNGNETISIVSLNSIGRYAVITVNPTLYSTGWKASTNPIGAGATQTLTANLIGGTAPYTYNMLVYNSIGLVTNSLYSNLVTTSNVFSYLQNAAWGTGAFVANVFITDSATTPSTVSNTLTYSVTTSTTSTSTTTIPTFMVSSFTANSNPILIGKNQILTANIIGGQTPYSFNILVFAPNGMQIANSLTPFGAATGNIYTYLQQGGWGSGSFSATVYATDNEPRTVSASLSYAVTTTIPSCINPKGANIISNTVYENYNSSALYINIAQISNTYYVSGYLNGNANALNMTLVYSYNTATPAGISTGLMVVPPNGYYKFNYSQFASFNYYTAPAINPLDIASITIIIIASAYKLIGVLKRKNQDLTVPKGIAPYIGDFFLLLGIVMLFVAVASSSSLVIVGQSCIP